MTFEAKGNLRRRARMTTALATIALMAGGYLVMSGATADTAAAASVNKALRADKLTEESPAGRTQFGPADDAFKGDMLIKVPQSGSSQANLIERILRGDVPIQVWPAGASGDDDDPERAAANDLFRSDPQYEDKYNADGQVDIYGGKRAVEPPRPPIELGRQQYTSGAYDESNTFFGQKNGLLPGLAVYGDWRTAIAYNDNAGNDIAQVATRVNVDIDLKLDDVPERTGRDLDLLVDPPFGLLDVALADDLELAAADFDADGCGVDPREIALDHGPLRTAAVVDVHVR